jgi:hypothetical protein
VKFRLVSSKLGSSSLKRLAEGLSHTLGYRVFRSINSKPNRNNLKYGDCKDKIYQYKWFQEKQIPALDFTTSQNEAKEWASSVPVFCRLLTKASEGKGIPLSLHQSIQNIRKRKRNSVSTYLRTR